MEPTPLSELCQQHLGLIDTLVKINDKILRRQSHVVNNLTALADTSLTRDERTQLGVSMRKLDKQLRDSRAKDAELWDAWQVCDMRLAAYRDFWLLQASGGYVHLVMDQPEEYEVDHDNYAEPWSFYTSASSPDIGLSQSSVQSLESYGAGVLRQGDWNAGDACPPIHFTSQQRISSEFENEEPLMGARPENTTAQNYDRHIYNHELRHPESLAEYDFQGLESTDVSGWSSSGGSQLGSHALYLIPEGVAPMQQQRGPIDCEPGQGEGQGDDEPCGQRSDGCVTQSERAGSQERGAGRSESRRRCSY